MDRDQPPGPDDSDELYNETVICQGYSRYETEYGMSQRYHAIYQAAAAEAKSYERGVWAR